MHFQVKFVFFIILLHLNLITGEVETDLNNSNFLHEATGNKQINELHNGSTIFDVIMKLISRNEMQQTETLLKYNEGIDKLGKSIDKLNTKIESIEAFLQPVIANASTNFSETTVYHTSEIGNHSITTCKSDNNKQCIEKGKDLDFLNLKKAMFAQNIENNTENTMIKTTKYNFTQKTLNKKKDGVNLTELKKGNITEKLTFNVTTPELFLNKEKRPSFNNIYLVAHDCFEQLQQLQTTKGDLWTEKLASELSGVHQIWPERSPAPFMVYCDFLTDSGGWTVLQTRTGQDVDFYRNYSEYRQTFGNINDDHWLGLDNIYTLTNQAVYELLIQLESFEGETAFARYSAFAIGSEKELFQMKVLGEFSGTAGDAMRIHAGMRFTTFDRDNDLMREDNCAVVLRAAWWFRSCATANLNGQYLKGYEGASGGGKGTYWADWAGEDYSLKKVVMKVRPVKK